MTTKEKIENMVKDFDEWNDFVLGFYEVEIDQYYYADILSEIKKMGLKYEKHENYIEVYLEDEDEYFGINFIEGNKSSDYKLECEWLDWYFDPFRWR